MSQWGPSPPPQQVPIKQPRSPGKRKAACVREREGQNGRRATRKKTVGWRKKKTMGRSLSATTRERERDMRPAPPPSLLPLHGLTHWIPFRSSPPPFPSLLLFRRLQRLSSSPLHPSPPMTRAEIGFALCLSLSIPSPSSHGTGPPREKTDIESEYNICFDRKCRMCILSPIHDVSTCILYIAASYLYCRKRTTSIINRHRVCYYISGPAASDVRTVSQVFLSVLNFRPPLSPPSNQAFGIRERRQLQVLSEDLLCKKYKLKKSKGRKGGADSISL